MPYPHDLVPELKPGPAAPIVKTDYSKIDAAAGTVIFLVEDNPADVRLIHDALKEHHVNPQLFLARDGDQAINILNQIDATAFPGPELVILDINLPKMLGFDVLSRIRSSPKCGTVPVAIFTSSTEMKDREEATRRGATAYLVKPSTLNEFMLIGGKFKDLLEASDQAVAARDASLQRATISAASSLPSSSEVGLFRSTAPSATISASSEGGPGSSS